MVPSGNVGRRKRDGNHSAPKNIVQDLAWNEENGYSDPDSNKTKINYTKEPNEDHKNSLKEEINETFIEMLLEMVNQNIQEALRNSKTAKLKNMRKHRNK
jgi:hypothetical protein